MKQMVFRRIRGRIIPITKKNLEDSAVAGAVGGYAGTIAGSVVASIKGQKDSEYIVKKIKKENQVDAKGFGRKANIKVLTSNKDLYKENMKPNVITKEAFKGNNAFAMWNRKKNEPLVIIRKKVNRSVLAHEIGHAIDLKKRKGHLPYNILTGSQYESEARAWDIAEKKFGKIDQELKKRALKTYERERDYQRIGLGGGALAASAAVLMKLLK